MKLNQNKQHLLKGFHIPAQTINGQTLYTLNMDYGSLTPGSGFKIKKKQRFIVDIFKNL
jgi:hypothetical protein